MRTKFALKILYDPLLSHDPDNRKDVERFFCDTLGIPGCTLETYVDELKTLRHSGSEDIDEITAVYKALDSLWHSSITQEIDRDRLKGQFEDHALIYAVSNEGPLWRKTSQCVWSTAARLRDMVSLNTEYENLRGLFVDVLGVKPVTLEMAIDELKEAGSRQSVAVEEVKTSILTVNALLCSESDQPQQTEFGDSKIFPVRYPGGGFRCVSAETQFFVVDLELLRPPFENHVKLLDFSLEEVVRLRHFLTWAHLEDRYISLCVRQITSVQEAGAQPISKHDRQFRDRAPAVLRYLTTPITCTWTRDKLTGCVYRIARHFESPRVTETSLDALYGLLRNAKIFATDKLFLELGLFQDGVSHKAQGKSVHVHLHEEGSELKIYLPRRKDPQDYAFSKHLPERILQWLMTDESSQIRHETDYRAVSVIKDVWGAPLNKLSITLDECGIIPTGNPNLDTYYDEFPSDTDSDVGDASEIMDTPASAADTMRHDFSGSCSGGSSNQSFTPDGTENEPDTLPVRPAPRSMPATPLEELPVRDTHYVSLLGRVIASARTSTIPDRNENQINTVRRGSLNIYGSDQFERDCKVGAAGELFVGHFIPLHSY